MTPTPNQKVPLTRPVSIVIHEVMLQPARSLANDITGGSLSKLLMILLYRELLRTGKVTQDLIDRLG